MGRGRTFLPVVGRNGDVGTAGHELDGAWNVELLLGHGKCERELFGVGVVLEHCKSATIDRASSVNGPYCHTESPPVLNMVERNTHRSSHYKGPGQAMRDRPDTTASRAISPL